MSKFKTSLSALLTLMLSLSALPVQAGGPAQIEVDNMESLLKAIGPNRTIRLKPGIYRISTALKKSPFVHWPTGETPTLMLRGVRNLQLIGSGIKNTYLVNDRCTTPVLDFDDVRHLRMQNLSFAHMLEGENKPLDCTPGVREMAMRQSQPLKKDRQAIQRWHKMARDIVRGGAQGVELPEYTAPLYPDLVRQVREESQSMPAENDALEQRQHSMRPRVGNGYLLRPQGIFTQQGRPAQAAAVIFDRSENLVVALDAQANVILAMEARNNTRRAWTHSEDWMMRYSIVPESNAPSPNGVYALGSPLKDSPTRGPTFGSYRILIEGGMPTRRQILFHSRDNRMTSEIPWTLDVNHENSRTLGCFLMQDQDLVMMARLIQTAHAPIALVVQGRYAKNLNSPKYKLDAPPVAVLAQEPQPQSLSIVVTDPDPEATAREAAERIAQREAQDADSFPFIRRGPEQVTPAGRKVPVQ